MAYLTLEHSIPSLQKGGRKVEGEKYLPPLKTPLFKSDYKDLVEVEGKYETFFSVTYHRQ